MPLMYDGDTKIRNHIPVPLIGYQQWAFRMCRLFDEDHFYATRLLIDDDGVVEDWGWASTRLASQAVLRKYYLDRERRKLETVK